MAVHSCTPARCTAQRLSGVGSRTGPVVPPSHFMGVAVGIQPARPFGLPSAARRARGGVSCAASGVPPIGKPERASFSGLSSSEDSLRDQILPYTALGVSNQPAVLGSTDGEGGFNQVLRVAYQGCPGAYSECAALQAYADGEMVPCEQFDIAFSAVTEWSADRAVLPIENSLGGSIHRNYDLLLNHRLHIVGEVSVAVNHCLLAMPGVQKADLKRVMSHPQALAQTEGYASKMLPGVSRQEHPDTAGAAAEIAKNKLMDTAAVASRRAAELYGLDILDEAIQDDKSNVTRFMVLAREPLAPQPMDPQAAKVPFKTSIVFSLNEGPGMLFKALSVFALRDIDLTKIESRPMRSDPMTMTDTGRRFKFLFYIDFVGSMSDVHCQNALRHLQEIATFMRVLGSYPMDTADPTKSH